MSNQEFQGRQGAFAPRRAQQQPQQTQVFQPQPNPFPPAQGGYPQQMPPPPMQQPGMPPMQGGMPRYAPPPPPPPLTPEQMQAMQQMQQQQQANYEKLYNAYYDTNQRIRNIMSDADANEHLEEMNEVLEKINGMDGIDDKVSLGSIDKVCMLIEQVATQIENPKLFLPAERIEKYEGSLKTAGGKIAVAMRQYATKISQLKVQ